jgi:DNA-binding NtrC family response regulator
MARIPNSAASPEKTMNILVLDSQRIHIESLARGLMIRGHDVFSASDGKKALDHLLSEEAIIDLIITDHAMALPDGMGLLDHLEKSGRRPPVIMMTTTGDRIGVLNPLCKVCGLFLEKPFSIEELLEAVTECVQRHGALELQN